MLSQVGRWALSSRAPQGTEGCAAQVGSTQSTVRFLSPLVPVQRGREEAGAGGRWEPGER